MELNDAFISIDSMGTIATITGIICLAIGIGMGIVEQRLTPVFVGIFLAGFLVYASDVVKLVVGIEEPSEQVQVLDDRNSLDISDDEGAKSAPFLLLAAPFLLVIVFIVVRTLDNESSVQDEDDALVESSHNQSPSPPEEIVLPNTQPEPEPQPMSSSVGSLKSTRKIQLD